MGRGEEKKKYLNRIEKQILRLHLGTTFAYAFAFFFFFFFFFHVFVRLVVTVHALCMNSSRKV